MDLKDISMLCTELKESMAKRDLIKAALKEEEEHIKLLSETSIPAALEELGLSQIKLSTGETISCKMEVRASIPKDFAPEALNWLESHGFGDLIKTTVKIKYDRTERGTAIAVYENLMNNGMNAALEETVHPMTLSAFVKEQLAKGQDLPFDLLGINQYYKTSIK